jgi:glycosyltransferase involved in cell wall biosynthesis
MLARFLGRLVHTDHRSVVLSLMSPGPLGERIAGLGTSIHSLGIRQGRLPLLSVPALGRSFHAIGADLVHGWMYHGNIAASVGSLVALRFAPVIWSIHHSLYDIATEKPLTQRLIRLSAILSRRTSAITYCSHVAAEQHEVAGFDPRRRVVIHNGIDCDEFRPARPGAKAELAHRLRIPEQRLIIGSIGRFHPMKDQKVLVQAYAELLGGGYDIQGLFVGAGHEDGVVRKTARELGIEERISTLGCDVDVSSITPGLDIHAISSAWGEAFSMATAEAMASGIPAVVTNVGDTALVVGNTGKIVARRDPKALAAALRELLDIGPDARRQLGLAARGRIVENFSLQRYVDKHLALYEDVLAGKFKRVREA